MSNHKVIKVSDFTTLPAARYISDGDGSAEEFFRDYLEPALDAKDNQYPILIDFDGIWGYPPSFVSELTLRLVRKYGDRLAVSKKVNVKSVTEPGTVKSFWEEVDKNYANENAK